jgi:hypothetical protein
MTNQALKLDTNQKTRPRCSLATTWMKKWGIQQNKTNTR